MILRYMAACPRCKCRFLAAEARTTCPRCKFHFLADNVPSAVRSPEHPDYTAPKVLPALVLSVVAVLVLIVIYPAACGFLLAGCGYERLVSDTPSTTAPSVQTTGHSTTRTVAESSTSTTVAYTGTATSRPRGTGCGIYIDQPEGGPGWVDGGGAGCP